MRRGSPVDEDLRSTVWAGEIVGIAGVSGNGQRELVEVLAGQREAEAARSACAASATAPRRAEIQRHCRCLPEEPLRNACVARMSVAENMAFRGFDEPPFATRGWWLQARRDARGRASA